MRPRFLEVEGLQSFKEAQRIDFDRLGETGLFGIFGPTGSGKSTILDAITLALYGSVLRAARGTQGIINTDGGTLRVSFTFDLLKDGKRRTYRVDRLYRRKKDSESSAEARMARLFETGEEGERVLADKTGEVTGKIEELLGLTLEDFTRSVVLPQNKFHEFLFMEKAKKREMLERIFYLEEYGRKLMEKVSKGLSEVRLGLSALGGAMASLGDVSEKALIEAESRLKAAREARDRADTELRLYEARYNEAKEVWGLTEELNSLLEKEKEHLKKQEQMSSKRRLLEDSRRAEGLADTVARYRQLTDSSKKAAGEYELASGRAAAAAEEVARLEEEARSFKEKSLSEKPLLLERKAKLSHALELEKEALELGIKLDELRQEYIAVKKQAASADAETARLKGELGEIEKQAAEAKILADRNKTDTEYRKAMQAGLRLEAEAKSVRLEKDRLYEQVQSLKAVISGLEKRLAALSEKRLAAEKSLETVKLRQTAHAAAKPASREELREAREKLHGLMLAVEALKGRKGDIDRQKAAAAGLEAAGRLKAAELEAAEKARLSREAILTAAREEYEQIRQAFEKNAAIILAGQLAEGECCPVCGSTHHPFPACGRENGAQEGLEDRLRDTREKVRLAEEQYRNAENESIRLKEQYKTCISQMDGLTEDISAREEEYASLAASAAEKLKSVISEPISENRKPSSEDRGPSPADPAYMETEVKKAAEENVKRQKELEAWELMQEKLREEAAAAGEEASARLNEENVARAELKVNLENLAILEKRLADAEESSALKQAGFDEFANRWNVTDPEAELKKIDEKDGLVEKYLHLAEQLQAKAKEKSDRLAELSEERLRLGSRLADLDSDGRNLKSRKLEKEEKVRELAGGEKVEAAARSVEQSLDRLMEKESRLAEDLKKAEAAFHMLDSSKSVLLSQKQLYEKELSELQSKLAAQLREKGFEDPMQVENAVLPRDKRDSLEKELEEFERISNNLRAGISLFERKLGGRTLTPDEWNGICGEYGKRQQEKEQAITAQENARSIFGDIKKRFEKWLELEKDNKKLKKKEDMLEQIFRLLKGNSFIEFISEERLRYVAREASEILGSLTKHRYALELDTENGFMIRDNSNGGVLRFVTSLSGGETFLTSLALALALSKQIQLKGQSPLEFFFLDEGFGTLDGNLLDLVVDALERFSSRDRVIGIISHVPELRNRIARRLIVDAPTAAGLGSRVRVEKA